MHLEPKNSDRAQMRQSRFVRLLNVGRWYQSAGSLVITVLSSNEWRYQLCCSRLIRGACLVCTRSDANRICTWMQDCAPPRMYSALNPSLSYKAEGTKSQSVFTEPVTAMEAATPYLGVHPQYTSSSSLHEAHLSSR